MGVIVREFMNSDIKDAIIIWNYTVESGNIFPQIEKLNERVEMDFFVNKSYTGVAVEEESNKIVGLYILNPNNIGRQGYICSVSYAIKSNERRKHIEEALIKDCIEKAKEIGFKILQFNEVVNTNTSALSLYEELGFIKLDIIPKGFLMKDGSCRDIIPYYYNL